MTELLGNLPPDSGAAVVLLQHLHAERVSLLPEILQKATRLPVRAITAGLRLERNSVYVAPSSHDVRLSGGVFSLVPKSPIRAREMPIDRLFESVAEQYDSRAVGVVLSGTLSDGALGLLAIKDAGGLTFAQDPATASFSEMPRAAVIAGGVDRVLAPDRIAREIVRFAKHPYIHLESEPAAEKEEKTSAKAADETDPGADRRLIQILRSATGVDFSSYRQSTFRRRVHRRMALRRIPKLGKYIEFLRANPQEIDALYDDILITVTRFFRDAGVFDVLRTKVFPSLIAEQRKNSTLRLWVPGCSTGEEVYSIAVTLFEAIEAAGGSHPFQIFATDISETALQKARAGEYLENSMVDVSDELRRTYFSKTGIGWRVAKPVRESIVFARQNVAADPPFSNIDFVSCRNLLIYMDPRLQRRVVPYFHYSLRPGGFLLLGRSESIGNFADLFEPFDRAHRIFLRRAALPRTLTDVGQTRFSDRAATTAAGRRLASGGSPLRLQEQVDRLLVSRYGPPGVLLDERFEVLQFRGRTTPFLEPASGSASLSILKLARKGLLPDLKAALERARKTGRRFRREGVRVRVDGGFRTVNLEVDPLVDEAGGRTRFLLLFESPAVEPPRGRARPAAGRSASSRQKARGERTKQEIDDIEKELQSTREYLQAIIEEQEASNEELKSANEEIMSANEELQSTNEELETAKEELQSTNEELTTVNEELQNRNAELAYAHNDLANVFGINLPILMVAANLTIRRFTAPAERLFGVAPSDVGRHISEFQVRLRNVRLVELIQQVLDSMLPIDREVQDDAGNWYSLRVKPYRTVDNRLDGAIIALFDLRTTDQITRSLDYAEALVETVRESLIVLDELLQIRSANRSFYRQFKTAPSRIVGRPLADVWNLRDKAPELLYLLESVVAQREPLWNYEAEIDFEGFGRRTLLVNARRVQTPGETGNVILVAFDDITERKWAEAGLKASELRYRLLFETAREGIWLLEGATGRVIDANPFLVDLFGIRPEELVGKVPWDVNLYRDQEAAKRRYDDLLLRGFSYDPEISMTSRSGETVHIEAVSNVYFVGNSRIVQCNMRDLSERTRLRGRLMGAQRLEAVGSLAGGVAHDFNNLLNIIGAHVELVGRTDEPEKQKKSLEAIRKTLERGSGVVKQLLTFARREKTSFEPVQLNAVVEEIVAIVRETFPKSLRIETRLAPDLPPILADAGQLHQALLNLLVNARDAMPKGGPITIATSVAGSSSVRTVVPEASHESFVELCVQDAGKGMDDATKRRLFEPFFTTKSDAGGQGLGLAVVATIAETHRAYLDVESELGRGTRFRLFFPATEAPRTLPTRSGTKTRTGGSEPGASGALAESAAPSGGSGNGQTILLVEDEDLLREAVGTLLESEGYRVLTARDGIEAVERHAAHRSEIAAVILDLELPKLGGWDAFLRMREADPHLKGIVASGTLEPDRRTEMRRLGLQASLRKPYAPAEMLKTVRQVLRGP